MSTIKVDRRLVRTGTFGRREEQFDRANTVSLHGVFAVGAIGRHRRIGPSSRVSTSMRKRCDPLPWRRVEPLPSELNPFSSEVKFVPKGLEPVPKGLDLVPKGLDLLPMCLHFVWDGFLVPAKARKSLRDCPRRH
jgi:hypothetical protein